MSTISLRDWQAPHISPTATLKLPASLCSHNPLWRWGSHFHCKGRGCRITRAIYRATKKCWGPGCVSTGSNKEVFLLFETLDVAFVAVVLALSVFLRLSFVYMGPDEIKQFCTVFKEGAASDCFRQHLFCFSICTQALALPESSESDIKMFLSNPSSQALNLPARSKLRMGCFQVHIW